MTKLENVKNITLPPLSPLLPPTLALIAGILFFYAGSPAVYVFVLVALVSLITTLKSNMTYLSYASIVLSFSWGYAWSFYLTSNHISTTRRITEKKTLTGIIEEIRPLENTERMLATMRIPEGLVKCTIPTETILTIGDRLTISKPFFPPSGDSHADVRDNYLASTRLPKGYMIAPGPTGAICWLNTRLARIETILKNKISVQNYPFFSTLFLGSSLRQPQEKTRNNFARWGISHYLARSGLHVAIILVIWRFFFRFLPLRFGLQAALLALTLGLYTALSYTSISFSRAVLAFTIASWYSLWHTRSSSTHTILLTCFITLAYNPLHLFFVNFQLSFTLAFIIAWLYELGWKTK